MLHQIMDKAIASKTSSAFSPNSDLFMPVLLEFMNGIINQKISMKWSADKCKYSKSKSSGDLTKESRSPKSDQQFNLYKSYIIWHFWFVCFSTQIADKLLWVKLWHFKWLNDPRSTMINGLFPPLPTCVLTQKDKHYYSYLECLMEQKFTATLWRLTGRSFWILQPHFGCRTYTEKH